jgi:hypothetical protein
LQKQLDSVQKLVIGLGRHLRAFDDQQEDEEGRVDTIPSKSIPEYEQYKKDPEESCKYPENRRIQKAGND